MTNRPKLGDLSREELIQRMLDGKIDISEVSTRKLTSILDIRHRRHSKNLYYKACCTSDGPGPIPPKRFEVFKRHLATSSERGPEFELVEVSNEEYIKILHKR